MREQGLSRTYAAQGDSRLAFHKFVPQHQAAAIIRPMRYEANLQAGPVDVVRAMSSPSKTSALMNAQIVGHERFALEAEWKVSFTLATAAKPSDAACVSHGIVLGRSAETPLNSRLRSTTGTDRDEDYFCGAAVRAGSTTNALAFEPLRRLGSTNSHRTPPTAARTAANTNAAIHPIRLAM